MERDTKSQNINEGFFSKQNILSFGILLLCSIMHLLMMKNMNHGTPNPESQINEAKKEELK